MSSFVASPRHLPPFSADVRASCDRAYLRGHSSIYTSLILLIASTAFLLRTYSHSHLTFPVSLPSIFMLYMFIPPDQVSSLVATVFPMHCLDVLGSDCIFVRLSVPFVSLFSTSSLNRRYPQHRHLDYHRLSLCFFFSPFFSFQVSLVRIRLISLRSYSRIIPISHCHITIVPTLPSLLLFPSLYLSRLTLMPPMSPPLVACSTTLLFLRPQFRTSSPSVDRPAAPLDLDTPNRLLGFSSLLTCSTSRN